jgi:hypothetical protein
VDPVDPDPDSDPQHWGGIIILAQKILNNAIKKSEDLIQKI